MQHWPFYRTLFLLLWSINGQLSPLGKTIYFFSDYGVYWHRPQLQAMIEAHGCKVKTASNLRNLPDARWIICYETPKKYMFLERHPHHQRILVTWEPPAVIPHNIDVKDHAKFAHICTWHDNFAYQQRYHKINYMVRRPMVDELIPFSKRLFCCLINKNINRTYKTSLTGARKKIIDFFHRNHSQQCALYGTGWNTYGYMNKGPIKGRDWRNTKINILKTYRFCICYENCAEPGYITEKIFDCFRAGTVPIYLGAPNITNYIPKSCFIDMRDFASPEQLYTYLSRIDEKTFMEYINAIRTYLTSALSDVFTEKAYVKTMEQILFPEAQESNVT